MNSITFKFKEHPGDFLRGTDEVQLPNPDKNLEDFLVYFLNNYQSDDRIAYLDDLYKLIRNEFFNDIQKEEFVKMIGFTIEKEIKDEIYSVETILRKEAYKNFYNLILDNKIELIVNDKK